MYAKLPIYWINKRKAECNSPSSNPDRKILSNPHKHCKQQIVMGLKGISLLNMEKIIAIAPRKEIE